MKMLTQGSHFDGVGAFPLAANKYGIKTLWATEIEAFPKSVSQKHFPHVKHYGDIRNVSGANLEPVDIITFGSPCQDLSVAGKREGLKGERSGLFMEAIRTVREMRETTNGAYPRFIIWENVPGAMSSNKGQDFRAVLEEIAETEIPMPKSGKWARAGLVRRNGCSVAWRILDAQYWGVPQRRRRIFLVADFTGQRAGEILFEPEGMCWHSQEGRKTGEEVAGNAREGTKISIYDMGDRRRVADESKGVTPTLTQKMGTGGNNVPITISFEPGAMSRLGGYNWREVCGTLRAQMGDNQAAIAYPDPANTLLAKANMSFRGDTDNMVGSGYAVRRLTPTECERLMGLPDGWTEGGSDTARYKALGNSIAVPCLEFIFNRLVGVLRDNDNKQ